MDLQPITSRGKIYSVSEITSDIKELIEDNFHSIWLKGEISNFKAYSSGHFYFTLKDKNAQISGVMFKGYNRRLKFELEDGMAILAHGRITVYEVRGQYQIIVDHIEPEGIGALQLAYEQLKEKLKKEGLFDQEHKKPIPFLPQKIGVVTSLHGAAVHDIMTVLKRRYPNIHIIIYPVKVQGEGSAQEIAQAINYFSSNQNVDTLIVGRGGGSIEDLWSFNEEIVARAVYDCPIPIISAVGHETDFSICDFVADLRAPTPSAAAELSVPVKQELLDTVLTARHNLLTTINDLLAGHQKDIRHLIKILPTPQNILDRLLLKLGDFEDRLTQCITLKIRDHRQELAELKYRILSPREQIKDSLKTVQDYKTKLAHSIEKSLIQIRHDIEQYHLKIELLSPKNILKRGYLIAKTPSGKLLTRRKQVHSGDKLALTFYDGEVQTKVE